ncbi:MAG: hypothetical protein ACLFVJ_08285 [Persicimonas sp.]
MSGSEGSFEPGPAFLIGVGIAGGWSVYQWNLVELMVAGSDVEHGDATVEMVAETSGMWTTDTYALDISYKVDGRAFEHSFDPKANYVNLNEGDVVPIRYLAEDPEVVGLGESSSLPIDGQICLGLAAVFVTYAVFAAVFPGWRI